MASIDTLVCPTDCSSILPIVSFNECNPELLGAQISDLFIWNDGYPLTDWTDLGELTGRISDSSSDPDAIRQIVMYGSLADPTVTEKKGSHGRKYTSPAEYVITGDVEDNSDINYDFARATGCNRAYRFLYATMGGKLYGGNEGIYGNLRMWEPIVVDDLEYATLKVEMKFTLPRMPLRIPNPLA